MDNPPPVEQLLKKIQELEAGQAHLKEQVSKLKVPVPELGHHGNERCCSVSTQPSKKLADSRTKVSRGFDGTWGARKSVKGMFTPTSPLQGESGCSCVPLYPSSSRDIGHPGVSFTNKQYLNILQSMGQSGFM